MYVLALAYIYGLVLDHIQKELFYRVCTFMCTHHAIALESKILKYVLKDLDKILLFMAHKCLAQNVIIFHVIVYGLV